MGKLHSKHAAVCKPRESPEGDSFVVNACLSRKGLEEWIVKQKRVAGHPQSSERAGCRLSTAGSAGEFSREGYSEGHYPLEVALPPENKDGFINPAEMKMEKATGQSGMKKQLKFEELECDVSVEEDNRQEWTFTLYDFDNNGKVTREDITSLLHTIYEVVDASVNHSPSSSKTLRVKLTVTPDANQKKKGNQTCQTDVNSPWQKADNKCVEESKNAEKKTRTPLRRHNSDQHPQQNDCHENCVDENTERRNHYLDLAGIENYSSKFGPGSPPVVSRKEDHVKISHQARSRSHEPEVLHSHHRRSQTIDPGHSHLSHSSYNRMIELQQRLRNQDIGKHFVKSPKALSKDMMASGATGKVGKNKPSQSPHMPMAASPNIPCLPMQLNQQHQQTHKKHKQRPKESHQMFKSFQPSSRVIEQEHVRDLPSLLLYEGHVGGIVQRHEHYHHHEHHHHYHHFYQT
ncbi:protein naked cuticle homolog 1 isoform X2 [Narcine bancroftii]|uniref:protein naked cuticle homolog 1 isoform X2 n=1 Tax=Narcine bancroftii TaxID=1343680 RepID=UPI00383231DF